MSMAQTVALIKALGSGGGALVVTATVEGDDVVCNKTAGEMMTAIKSGSPLLIVLEGGGNETVWTIDYAYCYNSGSYAFESGGSNAIVFNASTADDYPTTAT